MLFLLLFFLLHSEVRMAQQQFKSPLGPGSKKSLDLGSIPSMPEFIFISSLIFMECYLQDWNL
jgi:hypothetical protein